MSAHPDVASAAQPPLREDAVGFLDTLVIGGAPVLRPLLARAHARFPDARIRSIYGMTEILPVAIADGVAKLRAAPSDGDEVGRIVMGGKSADELMAMREEDDSRLSAEFETANCRKLSFRCRAKMDTFGDAQR